MIDVEGLTSNPKFTARYTLCLFLLSKWAYENLVVGPDGIADFSSISNEVFNDHMFHVGAYKQICNLMADINDSRIVSEMMESGTLLLDKSKLRDMLNLDETKMKELADSGASVYDMLLTKKLAEQTIFDDAVMPASYSCIDGSDHTATDISIPLSLVFSVDLETINKISSLLDLDNLTSVSDTVSDLLLDDKLACFRNTFDFIKRVEK